jgi:hypothetical protein
VTDKLVGVAFKQSDWVLVDGWLLTEGNALTVTTSVSVSWAEQPVAVMVANTLKVVVPVKFPVGKLIVLPSPSTAVPTPTLPAAFLNW